MVCQVTAGWGPLTPEQRQFYEENFEIVRKVARIFGGKPWARAVGDYDERVQVLALHFVYIVRMWQPGRSAVIEFEHFAFKALRRRLHFAGNQAGLIRTPARAANSRASSVERARAVTGLAGLGDGVEDNLAENSYRDRGQDALADREIVDRLLAELRPRERMVVDLYLGLNDGFPAMHRREIAAAFGVTPQRVQQLLDAARLKMRKAAQRQGLTL